MWKYAINSNTSTIIINSFNNWIDGSQIEPPSNRNGIELNENTWFNGEQDPNAYLTITQSFSKNFKSFCI